MIDIDQRRELVLKDTKEIVENSLLPELETARSILAKRLKKSSSVDGITNKV